MIGLPLALAFKAPDHWCNLSAADMEISEIDGDFCLIHEVGGDIARYIRCVLPMPVAGLDDLEFGFGVWMSVSERSWKIYRDGFDSGEYVENGCFGYLGNSISAYPGSLQLGCDVYFQPDRQRPRVHMHKCENPLAIDQLDGIKIEIIEALVSKSPH